MVKVLALYDDLIMRQFLGSLLEMAGYHYIDTDNTQEALSILRNDSPDLFIMPYYQFSSSYYWEELYDRLKADPELRKIGVIILWAKTGLAKEVYDHGDSCLIIPFPTEDLLITAEKVLRNYGKGLPTIRERQTQFEQQCDKWKQYFNWSDEELEKHRTELLGKAGYDIDMN